MEGHLKEAERHLVSEISDYLDKEERKAIEELINVYFDNLTGTVEDASDRTRKFMDEMSRLIPRLKAIHMKKKYNFVTK